MSYGSTWCQTIVLGDGTRLNNLREVSEAITERRVQIAEDIGDCFVVSEYREETDDVSVGFYQLDGRLDFDETIDCLPEAVDWIRCYTNDKNIRYE